MNRKPNHIQWIKTGAICGLLGAVVYFGAAFAPLPDLLVYIFAFAFGPLLAIGCAGIYYFLSIQDNSPRLQIAVVSAVAGGITLLIMLTVQQSIFGILEENKKTGLIDQVVQKNINNGLNSIHWGLDIAWDILISVATILFGYSMFKRTGIWKWLGLLGLLLGLLLLSFNLYFFPHPPASFDSIDWGPFVALWYIIVFITLLASKKKIKEDDDQNLIMGMNS
jgi:uncharacterized membrane protein YedE/YeeE